MSARLANLGHKKRRYLKFLCRSGPTSFVVQYEIARTISELLEWKRPNGRLKNHECRLLLEKLSAAGLVSLPAVRESGPRGPRVVLPTENGVEQEPVSGSAGDLAPLTLTVVRSGPESSFMERVIRPLPLSRIQSSGRG
jgi:hypothetical protein